MYFYEHFLGAYDPKLRKERGVYYTPVEVVRTQVRLAAELLRTRFGKNLDFADEDVSVLDPAVGTGTYPLAVVDHVEQRVRNWSGEGAVAEKMHSLADRLYAFEILVGPYSVAHLRLSQRFREAGVVDKTPKVYLTDTLESPNRVPEFTSSLLQVQLTQERTRAQKIKKNTKVFVCLGNPPYDRDNAVRRRTSRYGERAVGSGMGMMRRTHRHPSWRISLRRCGRRATVAVSTILQRLCLLLEMGPLEGVRLRRRRRHRYLHHRVLLPAGARLCRYAAKDARSLR